MVGILGDLNNFHSKQTFLLEEKRDDLEKRAKNDEEFSSKADTVLKAQQEALK